MVKRLICCLIKLKDEIISSHKTVYVFIKLTMMRKADIWFCCLATTMLWCKHECASMPRNSSTRTFSLFKSLPVNRDKDLNLNHKSLDSSTSCLIYSALKSCYIGICLMHCILRFFWNKQRMLVWFYEIRSTDTSQSDFFN